MTIKYLINFIYILLIVEIQAEDWHARWERAGVTWSEKWINTFEQIETYSEEDRIEILSAAARAKSAMRGVKPTGEQFAIGNRAASMLIAIPGHAEYFRFKIEKRLAARKQQKKFRDSYDRELDWDFEKLAQLASPETIKVLGEYLSDERDAAKEAIWEPTDYFLIGLDTNSHYALGAISSIGLRDADFAEPDVGPEPSRNSSELQAREEHMRVLFDYYVAQREAKLKPWLAWYAEVKAGKRTFSFKGQNVEYRFKPDGTWETITLANPPDDGPKPTKPVDPAIERPDKRASPAAAVEQVAPSRKINWIWPVSVTFALLIGVIGLLISKSKKSV